MTLDFTRVNFVLIPSRKTLTPLFWKLLARIVVYGE
jgi:hypothetical protein